MNQLIKPLNFGSYTFRASSAGKLCGKPAGKTPMDKFEECQAKIAELEAKCEAAKNKETKTYLKDQEKIAEKKKELIYLDKHKNDRVLSQTAISYLIECYTEARYGVRKEIHGKFLDSGTAKEADSIKLLRVFDDELYRSYKEYCIEKGIQYRQFNEYVEGECDILYPVIEPEIVIDIKSVWDMFTFQPHTLEKEIDNDIYKWQGVVYCKLYRAMKFKLAYCLVDMPDALIDDEIKRIIYKYGSSNGESDECKSAISEFIRKCKFDHIPVEARVIPFEYTYNEEDYQFLVGQIEMAREWLNNYAISEWERETRQKWTIVTEETALNDIAENEHFEAENGNADNFVAVVEQVNCPKCNSDSYIPYFNGEVGNFKCYNCDYDTADVIEPESTDAGRDEQHNNVDFDVHYNPEVVEMAIEESGLSDMFKPTSEHIADLENQLRVEVTEAILGNDGISSEPVVEPTPEPIVDELIVAIDNCKTRDEVIDLYIGKGAAFWSDAENKKYVDALTVKRLSFTAPAATPTPAPTPKPKKESAPVAPQDQEPVEKKPVFKIPVSSPQEGDKEKLDEFRYQIQHFTTVAQYKDLYIANRELIDRNIDFRNEYNEAGKAFAMKLAQQKRDEIQRQAIGG